MVEGWRRRWPVVAAVLATSALILPAALPCCPPPPSPAPLGTGSARRSARPSAGRTWWTRSRPRTARSRPTSASHAGIYATNYGEAGAIDRFGPSLGLPHAWSGHNGYGLWGPPPQDVAPVVVVWEDATPDRFFTGCRKFADVTAPVSNEESDRASVYVCDGPIGGWAHAWAQLIHLSS